MRCYTLIPSPVGMITVVCKDGNVTNLWLPDQRGIDLTNILRRDQEPVLVHTRQWLQRYFSGETIPCMIPLAPHGTPFQLRVWEILSRIPYGTSVTYGHIAADFGKMSSQAMGQAVGRNPISILIPCHRVLGAGGKLTGYDGGLDKKKILLDIERIPYKA